MDTINSSESHQQVVSTPDRLSSSITHDSYSLDDEAAQEFEHAHDHNKATAELPRDIQPVRVTVDRLSVWVRPSKLQQWLQGARVDDEQRGTLILNNIRAILEPGKLIAIMGASGSGKTTLLNTLAGRLQDGRDGATVKGRVLLNNRVAAADQIKRAVGYVLQHDNLLPNLTVRETLMFAGLLRLPTSLSTAQKTDKVEQVLRELGLFECAGTRVGGDGSHGASGGERRRVSIGMQMLTDPSVLFLDEPTSGLDSFTANKLMHTLRAIAHRQRTVICTIHQPRSDIFRLCDSIILLAKGKLVFAGSIPQAMEFFASAGFQCPTHVNPGDFFLDLISVDSRTPQAARESLDRISLLVELFARSNASEEMDSSLDRAATQAEDALEDRHGVCEPSSSPLSVVGSACTAPPSSAVFRVDDSTARSRINYFSQTLVLLQRSLINMARDRMVILSRVLEALLLGFLVGMIFFQLEDTPSGIKSRIAALYSASSLQPFLIMLSIIIQFSQELPVYDREYHDDMLDLVPYFCSMLIASFPFAVILPIIFSSVFYFMVGLRLSASNFWWFTLTLGLAQYCAECFGFLCTTIFRHFGPASLCANTTVTFWNLSCGFLINPASFPFYLTYIAYTSYYSYEFAAMAINEFAGNSYNCPFPPSNPSCALYNGDRILESLNLLVSDIGANLVYMSIIAASMRIISLLILFLFPHKPE